MVKVPPELGTTWKAVEFGPVLNQKVLGMFEFNWEGSGTGGPGSM